MMQLTFAVISIMLASALGMAGMSYFHSGTGTRLVVARALLTQKEAIDVAWSSYRAANGGLLPPAGSGLEARLSGFLPNGVIPPMPQGARHGFAWRTVTVSGSEAICVELSSASAIDRDAADGIVNFAKGEAFRLPAGRVMLGTACGSGQSDPDAMNATSIGTSAAVTFTQG